DRRVADDAVDRVPFGRPDARLVPSPDGRHGTSIPQNARLVSFWKPAPSRRDSRGTAVYGGALARGGKRTRRPGWRPGSGAELAGGPARDRAAPVQLPVAGVPTALSGWGERDNSGIGQTGGQVHFRFGARVAARGDGLGIPNQAKRCFDAATIAPGRD